MSWCTYLGTPHMRVHTRTGLRRHARAPACRRHHILRLVIHMRALRTEIYSYDTYYSSDPDDDDVYSRETPPHIRTARASPQRHTAAGTAASTTADTGNTVSQRANPTQTAYAHPRRRAQAQGQRLGTWTLVRPQKAPSADSTQWYHRKIGTSTITVPDVGLRPGFLPPRRAGVYLPLNPLR